ncbi:hypothetical protein [Pseudomonas sp. GTC 16482]|uniref:hypothetical protein n=1 Tax=Pseudomonas sp. GTC 16482 TaxID=1661693 RepID=UPI000761DF9C|nr:hypothetical protein [Pseudomonas sp. GTC 16482]
MAVRQIIQLAGSLDIPGLPQLDVSSREIEIANLASLKLWGATAKWGISNDDLGLEDRVTANKIPLNGSPPSTRLENAFDGKPALLLGAAAAVVRDTSFDTTGSFTVAFNQCPVADDLSAVGASSAALPGTGQSYWFISTAGGKFRIGTSNLFTQFTDYTGPVPSKTAWLRMILKYDRAAGTMTLYVNGAQQVKLTNDALKTLSLAPGVCLGGIVTTSSTPGTASCYLRSPMAFSSALTDGELALVDKYLAETYY